MATDWDKELRRAINKAMEIATAVIRKDGPSNKPYCVYSERTGRNFGCYKTRREAEKRLAQLEKFKHMEKD